MNLYKKKICLVWIIIMICFAFVDISFVSHAEENKHIVKVAYLISPGYQEGGTNEYKSGQGYEYLQKIAGYTGWTYEYVYGDFGELLQKLEKGEIDLMGNLSYSEERAKLISYSNYEQGKEAFYLYVKGSKSPISPNDYSSINGKKIGVAKDSFQEELWKSWCKAKKIHCKIIEFTTIEKRQEALNDGSIDATIGSFILNEAKDTKDWRGVLKFGDSPYYFCVNKKRPDILSDLNYAQEMILDENPYYNEELSTQYLRTGIITETQLKEVEIQWLKEHDGKIIVGCLDDYLPLSDRDENGKMKGVIPDLLSAVEDNYKEYGVQFEQKVYVDYEQMVRDLKKGKIDLAAPIYGDYWNADQAGFTLTNSFMSTTMLLINDKNYSPENIKKIAVDKQSPLQAFYARIYYPEYELVMYPSMTEVGKALVKGDVDVGLSTACCYHLIAKQDRNIKNMNRATLPRKVNMAMAVSKSNPELMSFMNRAMTTVGETQIFNSLAVNSNVDAKTTLADYVSANPIAAMVISGVTIITLLVIIIRLRHAIRKSKTDSMTGLLNKIAMQEMIKEQMYHGGILFMIDIDNFKMVNDCLGHKAGDQVIIQFASNLGKIFRSGDVIGRFGGDEFMVFLPGIECSKELIQKKVDKMQEVFDNNDVLKVNKDVICSVSVGVVFIKPNEGIGYTEAFEKADAALYEAKKLGKNTFVIAE